MEFANAAGIELRTQFGRDGGRDQLARGRQIVEPFEQAVHPRRDGGAALGGELAGLGDVGQRQDARHQLGVDARRVAELGVAPKITTGVLDAASGAGQIGAGVAEAPLACFVEAVVALDRALA